MEKRKNTDRHYQPATPEVRLLNICEAADYLGISVASLYTRSAPKAKDPFPVKPKKIGKRILFDIRELEEYVNAL